MSDDKVLVSRDLLERIAGLASPRPNNTRNADLYQLQDELRRAQPSDGALTNEGDDPVAKLEDLYRLAIAELECVIDTGELSREQYEDLEADICESVRLFWERKEQAKTCTCPSGDGSLRWPCPVHPPEPAAGPWNEGSPPHPWDSEWFLAKMVQGALVVLRPLPEEYTYDFMTADGTYVMRKSIARWAQLSGSEYIAPEPVHPPEVKTEPVLSSPAKVGSVRFGKGVKERLVIEAAQRQFEYSMQPDVEADRLDRLRATIAEIHAPEVKAVAWECDDSAGETGRLLVTNDPAVRDEWVRQELPVCPLFGPASTESRS